MSLEQLEESIQNGDLGKVREILTANPKLTGSKTSLGVSPLMLSCYYKKPQITAIIVSYIEPDIYESAAAGKFDSLTNIVYRNPELVNTFSDDGFTPLGLASYFGYEEIARFLLLKGAEVNLPSQNGFNVFPLHSSVASNHDDITKILLEAGAEVNVRQQSGITPLHSAAHNGNIEVIILLLEAGARVDTRMEDGKTPADKAEEKGFKEIAKILAV